MGTAYIRLKFTPIIKYFPRANSNNCWLEIIPTVSCIENLDKLEWSQQKGSVEYTVPMTYKIILKKREPAHQLRVYYSCVDLMPSSPDLSAGDVHRHISEHFILSKAINENFGNIQDFDPKINCRKHNNNTCNKVSSVVFLPISKVKQTEKENVQVTDKSEYQSIEKDYILREKRTETENTTDKSISNDRSYAVSHINADKNKEIVQKKLCLTKLCKISTEDEISLCNKYVNTDFITMPYFKPSINRIGLNNIQTKNIEFVENIYRPFRHTLLNCFVRVEPEIRVAQFVENMEKEVFPLKVLLNDILKKCATYGLKNSISSNISGVNKYMSLKNNCYNKTFEVQKEMQSNRVVYSIVFDS